MFHEKTVGCSVSKHRTCPYVSKTSIIFDKVGGSWWKPEYRIIVGGKTKKDVQVAAEMLQKNLNGGKIKNYKLNVKCGQALRCFTVVFICSPVKSIVMAVLLPLKVNV